MAKPERMGALLNDILKRAEASYPDNTHRLWDIWEAAVGPDLASRCAPLNLRSSKLTVAVESPVWLQQLSLFSTQLAENINSQLGGDYVKSIVFKQATIPKPPTEVTPLPDGWDKRALTAEEERSIRELTGEIDNPEIKKAIQGALSMSIRRESLRHAPEDAQPPRYTYARKNDRDGG